MERVMKRDLLTKISGMFVTILLLSVSGYGQAASTEEMMQVIKRLEARIAELEEKVSRISGAPAAQTPRPAPTDLQQEVEALKKTASENAPISPARSRNQTSHRARETQRNTWDADER
jgi:hypothetical protein